MEKWQKNADLNDINNCAGLISDFAIVMYTVDLYDR